MQPRIIDRETFEIIGIELRTTSRQGKNFADIPRFWQDVLARGLISRILDRTRPATLLGMCLDFAADDSFSYIIGAEVGSSENKPADMVARTIPAATYAVFTARGSMPDAIQQTTRDIYRQWLPHSGYRRADGFDIEVYDERFEDTANPAMDIYVPVVASA